MLSEDCQLDEITVAPFPLWVLPTPLADFVTEVARAISCPVDYVTVPMLAVLGTAIGTRRRIQVKEGWHEWPIVWTATVGDTGTAKSPAQEKAVEPLVRLQEKLLDEHEDASQALRLKKVELNARKGVRSGSTTSGVVPGSNGSANAGDSDALAHGVILQLPQVFTTDTTLEALNFCLARNPHGIALVRDELTAWMLSMNEYKKGSGADRPHWQSTWNASQIVVNRKNNKKPIIIPRPFVCVVGGLPPDMLGELCDERGREDGFIHRILFTFPDPVPRILTDEGVSRETTNRYCTVFEKLRALRGLILLPDPVVTLEFAPDAFAAFRDWANRHFAEMDAGPTNLRGPRAKLVTYCARFALIIHLTRKVCDESVAGDTVDEESVRRAITLVSYFKSHTRKVYRHLHASPEERQITTAVEWLKKKPGRSASLRDFVTNKVAGVKTSEDALAVFHILEANGWGSIENRSPPAGGRTSIRFVLDCRPSADRLQMIASRRK